MTYFLSASNLQLFPIYYLAIKSTVHIKIINFQGKR